MVLTDVVDLRDVGMPQAGGRPGLDLEAADVFRRRQVRGQDHLDGHGAVQGLLPRLVDHAHAAPADFLHELVGAEIAGQGLVQRIRELRKIARRDRHESFQRLQALQRRRQLRVFAEHRRAVRPLARLKLRQVVVEKFGKLGIVGNHSIASCSFLIARIQSICTAGRVRSMRSATSLNDSRCRFRSTMTS